MGSLDPNAPVHQIEDLIQAVAAWAAKRGDIQAVALVGSWARGTARPGSDVDIVILTTEPLRYIERQEWAMALDVTLAREAESWGAVTSRRGITAAARTIEFGITTPEWPGGDQVLREGARIIYDPVGVLAKLMP